jgi:hypothetical protein
MGDFFSCLGTYGFRLNNKHTLSHTKNTHSISLTHTQKKTHTHSISLPHTKNTHSISLTHTQNTFAFNFKRMCPRFQVQYVCVRERNFVLCTVSSCSFYLVMPNFFYNKLWSRLNESQIDLKVSLDEGVSLTIIGGNTKEIVNNADEQTQM